jgi:hypothetical protein
MSIDGETQGAASFDRRKFLKRVALVTAFAAPVISSFTMDGVSSVLAAPHGGSSNSSGGNHGQYDDGYFGNANNGDDPKHVKYF